nr:MULTISPECIES: hypothetical protein [Streptomyces]
MTSTFFLFSAESTMFVATWASLRMSLKTVCVCWPDLIDFTEATSASWPVMTGSGLLAVP